MTLAGSRILRHFSDGALNAISDFVNLTSRTDQLGRTTQNGYDVLNRLESVLDPREAGRRRCTTAVYDAAGNVIRTHDELNYATTFAYDVLNRMQATTRPGGGIWTTVYDAASNPIAGVDPLGNRSTTVYDTLNRATASIDALGGRTTAVFDAVGNRTVVIDASLNRTTFAYDALQRVTQHTDPLNRSATFAYDAASQMTSTTDRIGRRRDFAFDAIGQMTAETWVNVGGSTANTLTYTYDAVSNLLTAKDADGANTFTYDALNRGTTSRDMWGVALTFSYDAVSNRTHVQDSFGGVATITFDALDRMETVKFGGPGVALRFDYGYTERGQMSGISRYSDLSATTKIGATSMSYDSTGRLTNLKHQDGTGSWFNNATFTYDVANRITNETINGTPKTFTYDTTNQVTNDNGRLWSYDPTGNRTNTGYTTGTGNQLTNDGTWTYTYDNEGNRSKKSKGAAQETWTYSYDHWNQLVWVEQRSTDGGTLLQRVDYKYDAFGRMIERTHDSDGNGSTNTTERHSYDGRDAIAELNGSNGLVMLHLFGGAEMMAPEARVAAGAIVAWYMADRQGSIVALSDYAGVVQSEITHNGFGKILTETGATFGDDYKYTGQRLDDATGLQLHNFRWYDAETQRWLSRDPIGFAAGDANLYRYVGNNATNATDRSGLAEDPLAPLDQFLREAEAARWYLESQGRSTREIDRERESIQRMRDRYASILKEGGEPGQALFSEYLKHIDRVRREYLDPAFAQAAEQGKKAAYEKWLRSIREYARGKGSDDFMRFGPPGQVPKWADLTPEQRAEFAALFDQCWKRAKKEEGNDLKPPEAWRDGLRQDLALLRELAIDAYLNDPKLTEEERSRRRHCFLEGGSGALRDVTFQDLMIVWTAWSVTRTVLEASASQLAAVIRARQAAAAARGLPPLRQAYIAEVEALNGTAARLRAAGKTPEEIARTVSQMRRDIGIKYKDLTPPEKLAEFYERNQRRYGDKLGPTVEWFRTKGKTWEEIIESASRPGGSDLGLGKP